MTRCSVPSYPHGWPLLVLLALGGATAHAAASPVPPGPPPPFGDEITVRLVTVVARVVDGAGNPILGLLPGDFRVRVGGSEVPVAAADWASHGEVAGQAAGSAGVPAAPAQTASVLPAPPAAAGSAPSSLPSPAAPVVAPEGPPAKLVVIFVQADNNSPARVRGHLHTLPFLHELLDSLQPEDLVAVVSFSSHLKLWQDFTPAREPVPQAIYQAIRFGASPPAPRVAPGSLSLARHLDFRAALDAASPERALAVTAAALAALPGEKVVILLAWGLGSYNPMSGAQMTPAFAPAVRALAAARATVFALDVTEADSHDLEVGLRGIADATGGTFDKTNLLPALAIRQLARTISGYYLLTLDSASLPQSGGSVEVELRGRRGTVLLRPTTLPASR